MLKRVVITNYLGESMEYKIEGVQPDEDPSGLLITSIDGLGPVKANINMLEPQTKDGGIFNSARLSTRNIVIKGRFTNVTAIEDARLLSYKMFPIKKKLTFLIETDNRTAQTEGYVESNEPVIFADGCGCQISILCEDAYFDGGKVGYTFSDTIPLFKFAFGNESLTEPLIEISENATVKDVREIVYEGDADAGMEIEIDAEDDVTGEITISGDNNTQMKLDLAKMEGIVPNTAPDHLSLDLCLSSYDFQKGFKFEKELPQAIGSGTAVVYHDEIHILGGSSYLGHYKWDGETFTSVSTLPIHYLDSCVIVYHDEIHLIGSGYWQVNGSAYESEARSHYKWNGSEWILVTDSLPYKFYRGAVVVYNDAIHYMGGLSQSPDSMTSTHWTYDETSGWKIKSGRIYDWKTDEYYHFSKGRAVIYDGTIHILGSEWSDSARKHYRYEPNQDRWWPVSELPFDMYDCPVIVDGNKIHILGFNDSVNGGSKLHYQWNGSSWSSVDELPYAYRNIPYTLFENKVYLFGGTNLSGWDTYTEDPNNVKLVADDKLVVNTIKGQKSISLYRGANKYNVLNALDKDSTWFQLQRGVNRFSYDATTGAENMKITMIANKLYEGM